MKKLLLLLLIIPAGLLMSQTIGIDKSRAPGVFTVYADTLGTAADSNIFSIYAPFNIYIEGMNVQGEKMDTTLFRLAEFGSETTAVDSVVVGSANTTSNMAVDYNNMKVTLAGGSTYRLQYIPTHTGGASHTTMTKVTLYIWYRLF